MSRPFSCGGCSGLRIGSGVRFPSGVLTTTMRDVSVPRKIAHIGSAQPLFACCSLHRAALSRSWSHASSHTFQKEPFHHLHSISRSGNVCRGAPHIPCILLACHAGSVPHILPIAPDPTTMAYILRRPLELCMPRPDEYLAEADHRVSIAWNQITEYSVLQETPLTPPSDATCRIQSMVLHSDANLWILRAASESRCTVCMWY